MKYLLIVFSLLSFSAFSSDDGPCSNFAKYGAIRAYKAEMGSVQGSDGIQYSAELKATRNNYYDYVVTIYDNNEDGDTWEVDYNVTVASIESKCRVIEVSKVDAQAAN